MNSGIRAFWASLQLRRANKLWRQRRDAEAIRIALAAARYSNAARVTAAIFLGVTGDWKSGIPLLEEASNSGYWEAKQSLAFCYANGQGVQIDLGRARELATEAADQGSLDCMVWLAEFYSDGVHRKPDSTLARKYGGWAAHNGRPEVLKKVEERLALNDDWGKSVYDPKLIPRD